MTRVGVLLMAHGTPSTRDEMPEYLRLVRGGRPQPDELGVFTAHSLSERVIASGDPYANQVAETARGVAERVGIKEYDRAYQSAGRTPEPWIGPSLEQLIDERSANTRKFLVVPI